MSIKLLVKVGVLGLAIQLLGCGGSEVSYSADVQPIFEQHCIECHVGAGEGVATSGFSVRDYESVMRGTDFGAVVVPGSSMSSTLYLVVAKKTAPEIQMPPHHRKALAEGRGIPLTDREIGVVQAWIDQGAKNN